MLSGYPKSGINKGCFEKGIKPSNKKTFEELHTKFNCDTCGIESFKKNHLFKKFKHHFCSKPCSIKWKSEDNKINTTKGYTFKRSEESLKKFRERMALKKSLTQIKKVCLSCKNDFMVWPCESNRKYCSMSCVPAPTHLLGKNHWNYKDGRTDNPKYHENFRKSHLDRYSLYQIVRAHKIRSNGGSFTKQEWFDLKEKFNFTCPCCKLPEPEIKLTVDHIIPVTKGGTSNIDNLQPLCGACNSKKYNKIMSFQNA